MRALAMAVLGESDSPTPPTPTYPTESIVYVAEADSNGKLYIPTSGRGQTTSTYMPYSWNVSIDGGTPTQYSGTSSTSAATRNITLSGYTAGTRHTIQITPVTEDYQWARAFGVYQSETAAIPATIKEILYDGSEKGFAISATDTGAYYKYYQWAKTGITSTYPETLPSTITTIGNYFRYYQYGYCTGLTTPAIEVLPSSVTSIGTYFRYYQYGYCTGLTTPADEVVPNSVTSIGTYFRGDQYYGCTGLTSTTVEVVSNSITSIGNYFRAYQYYGCTSLTSPAAEVMPSLVTSIGTHFRANQYKNCTGLTSTATEVISSSVTSIGINFRMYQYDSCTSLTTPAIEVMPSSVTSIGHYFRYYQYHGCTGLTSPAIEVLPSSVTSIGNYFRTRQYDGCASLTYTAAEVIPDSITYIGNYFRSYQYQNCTSLTETAIEVFPSSVSSLGTYFRYNQYANCSNITHISGMIDTNLNTSSYRANMYLLNRVTTIKMLSDISNFSYSPSLTYAIITRVEVPNAYLSNYVNTTNDPRASIADSAFVGYYPWTPGANTIAYYPLEDDFNDHSGNGYNLTNSGLVLGITSDGYKAVYLNAPNVATTSAFDFETPNQNNFTRTLAFCFGCNTLEESSWSIAPIIGASGNTSAWNQNLGYTTYDYSTWGLGNAWVQECGWWAYNKQPIDLFNLSDANNMHTFVITIDVANNEYKAYKDGVLVVTATLEYSNQTHYSGFRIGSVWTSYGFNPKGYMRQVVVDNSVWSASDALSYHNSIM